jgi:hypothetical protein
VPSRRRLFIWLGAIALIATAVVTLRTTEDTHTSDTDSDAQPEPVTVERYAADNVVLPAPGGDPAPPARVVAEPERDALRVSWADALPGGQVPDGAAGYEVRWRPTGGEGTDRDFGTRLVATPDVLLEGLTNGREHDVEVRTVDAFGQRSKPVRTTGTPGAPPGAPPGAWTEPLTGLFDEFAYPAGYADRWHLSGYRGCVDVVAERGRGLPIELGCGADLAVLRAKQPMTLTAPTPAGELGRVAVRTDTAGTGGELTITLAPGPVDRVGADTQRAHRFPPRDGALPGGTIRVGVDDGGVHVSSAPDVPAVAPQRLEVFPAPVRGPYVAHLFEVVLTTSGLRVYQDGLLVAVAGVVPAWRSASVLLGFRGPERRRSRVHLVAAGFTGPAAAVPPGVEVPVNAGTQRVLDLTEPSPQVGIARTPLEQARAARLVATLVVAQGVDPRGMVVQFGNVRVPARPAVAAPSAQDGAALTVVGAGRHVGDHAARREGRRLDHPVRAARARRDAAGPARGDVPAGHTGAGVAAARAGAGGGPTEGRGRPAVGRRGAGQLGRRPADVGRGAAEGSDRAEGEPGRVDRPVGDRVDRRRPGFRGVARRRADRGRADARGRPRRRWQARAVDRPAGDGPRPARARGARVHHGGHGPPGVGGPQLHRQVMLSTTASATAFIVARRSMAVRWIQRKASGSDRPCLVISRPLARSMSLRVSIRSVSVATSVSRAASSENRLTASSIAGTRSCFANGFTR